MAVGCAVRLCKAAAFHSALQGGFYAVRHPSGMMFCGAVPRNAGASGDAAVRFVLLTFHHRRVVPSGAVKIRFQSKGFSLVEFSCTGRAFGAAGAQGAKSWARMPTAVQFSGTSAAR